VTSAGLLLVGVAAAQQVVEFPEGEILASIRVRSMGGAATGLAESASAHLLNPASMAVRRSFEPPRELDWDLTLQARDHPLLDAAWQMATGADPAPPPRRLGFWQLGGNTRFGRHAGALHFRGHSWDTGQATVGSGLWSAGVGTAGGTWAVGLMPQVLAYTRNAETTIGFGATVGGLWAPEDRPLRLGARLRTPMRTGEIAPQGLIASRLPFEAAVGGSWAFGAYNVAGEYGPERHRNAPDGPTVLAVGDLVVTGGSGRALALEPLIRNDRRQRTGPTTSVRLGTEVGLLDQELRVRAGAYTVPSRGAGKGYVAGTTGLSYQIAQDQRGVRVRATGMVEAWASGWSWGVGIETW
jgi:hypothetical protein